MVTRTCLNFLFIRTLSVLFVLDHTLQARELATIFQSSYSVGHEDSQWNGGVKPSRSVISSYFVFTHKHTQRGSPSYNHAYVTTVTQQASPASGRCNAHVYVLKMMSSGPFVVVSRGYFDAYTVLYLGICSVFTFYFMINCLALSCALRGKRKMEVIKVVTQIERQ
jgi:hypothetical protein